MGKQLGEDPEIIAAYGGQEILMSADRDATSDLVYEATILPTDGGLTAEVRVTDSFGRTDVVLCTVRKTMPDEIKEAVATLLALDDVSLRAYMAQLPAGQRSRLVQ